VLLLSKVESAGRMQRQLSVIKMRFSAHENTLVHSFMIAPPEGIIVHDGQSSSDDERSGAEGTL
jgi:hypothetical protein